MSVVYILVIILLLLAVLLFNVALKVIFVFNTDKENLTLTLLWLYPFMKSTITKELSGFTLTIYLLNKKVYAKALASKKGGNTRKGLRLIKAVKPTDVHVNTKYGFRDPFMTGVACGAVNAASQLISIDSLQQNPDFTADNDYIYLNATAKVNVGSTLVNLLRT